MSPNAHAQIEAAERFVADNYGYAPDAVREYVADLMERTERELRDANSDRRVKVAIAKTLGALRAAKALAELEAGGGRTVTANQPEFAARVRAAMAA